MTAAVSRFLGASTNQPVALWTMNRHGLIGRMADRLLAEASQEQVAAILQPGGGTTLEQVAAWPDLLKGSQSPNDPETVAFLADPANREHARWHYLNLPFATVRYEPARLRPFIPSDGAHVVEMTVQCARAVVAPTPRLSRTNGLRWLAHLIGDLHQPMHLGCGFLDESTEPPRLVGDPAQAASLTSDRGGNNILLPAPFEPKTNLHFYWDGALGSVGLSDVEAVTHHVPAPTLSSTSEEVLRREVVSWVDETLVVCSDAYWSIRITARDGDDKRKMRAVFDDGLDAYEERNEPHVPRQMARAAVRLAATVEALIRG